MDRLRDDAQTIWQAAVAAADPFETVRRELSRPDHAVRRALEAGGGLVVIGGGKAAARMAAGVEAALADYRDRMAGTVSVPAGAAVPLESIEVREVRPAGSNHPTAEAVTAVEGQLQIADTLGSHDIALCLLSGGGSALLPAPVAGVSLADKQEVTRLLHASGATINEMNAVRKHLSRVKGGRLAARLASRGAAVVSLIISDVVGDPLDVIASGPTAADPTTFADALAVLERHGLLDQAPASVLGHLRAGAAGDIPETPKTLPPGVQNVVLASNSAALEAATAEAAALGYAVVNLGSFLEGETRHVAGTLADIMRSVREHGVPLPPPVCLLSGGETTVTLGPGSGKGGRNQEFVLACLLRLEGRVGGKWFVLSGGTDGEDGPTDAAGAVGDPDTLARARAAGLEPRDHLARHDAYPLLSAAGDLLRSGLTGTNVMDVRVMLIV